MPSGLVALPRAMNSLLLEIGSKAMHAASRTAAGLLKRDFSSDAGLARRQRLAVAHIEAEIEAGRSLCRGRRRGSALRPRLAQQVRMRPCSLACPKRIFVTDGARHRPGQCARSRGRVGRHVAPETPRCPRLLERWAGAYGGVRRGRPRSWP